MKKTTVLIVDDEKLARDRLHSFLKGRAEEFDIQEAQNGVSALGLLKSHSIDILLLDIQMPELSGMELLAQVEHRNFQVIFQTAFDEYAIQAFEAHACDYLLKPFPQERFNKALDRALKNLRGNVSLEKVESDLRKRDGFLGKICAKVGAKTVLIPVGEIVAFVSQDHYTAVVAAGREYIIDLSLGHLEERLDPAKFQRLHRNNIVSMDRVRAVHSGENMQVELENGQRLPVSRNNRKKVSVT